MTSTTLTKSSTKKPRRMSRQPQENVYSGMLPSQTADATLSAGDAVKPATKSAIVIGLLTRSEGTTLEAMVAATGWLPHTTRAALTGLKKKGLTISSEKMDGVRTYRAALPDKQAEGELGEAKRS